MLLSRLEKTYRENIFADLVLILSDDTCSITINVHKHILYASGSDYFCALLTRFKDKDSHQLSIVVPCAPICKDIIESFYGIKHHDTSPLYLIRTSICLQFLCLDPKIDTIISIDIPANLFNFWVASLDMLDQFHNIDLICSKISTDYDLEQLPDTLVERLIAIQSKPPTEPPVNPRNLADNLSKCFENITEQDFAICVRHMHLRAKDTLVSKMWENRLRTKSKRTQQISYYIIDYVKHTGSAIENKAHVIAVLSQWRIDRVKNYVEEKIERAFYSGILLMLT